MKFKWSYILISLFLVIIIIAKSGLFSFRKNDEQQRKYILAKGQEIPHFHTYTLGNRTMHYTSVEEQTDYTVVFVHVSPGSSSGWLDYLADTNLTKQADLIAIDRAGFGYSNYGKSEPSIQKQAALLLPILEKNKASKIILVGHSLGGPVVARMAMDYPQLIHSIIMLAPSIAPELEPQEWYRKPLNWRLVRWMLPTSFKVSNQEILPLKGELEKMKSLWKTIQCPVTVLQGESDSLVPKGNADYAKKMLINSKKVAVHILEGAGHFLPWEHYEKVVEAIEEQIKKEQ